MNNDVMPAGTWAWLEALGYSRSDVERITARRLGAAHLESTRLDKYLQDSCYGQRIVEIPKPAEDEGKEIPGGSYSGLYPFPKINRVLDAAELSSTPLMLDAVPMTKAEILERREEGCWLWFMFGINEGRMTVDDLAV